MFESTSLNVSKLSKPLIITTGIPSSAWPIIKEAAADNSSQVAISVVSSSLPYKSFSPTRFQIGEISFSYFIRISLADLSESLGIGVARPSAALDSSIPALAQTKPCTVSVIIKLGPTSTISFD